MLMANIQYILLRRNQFDLNQCL